MPGPTWAVSPSIACLPQMMMSAPPSFRIAHAMAYDVAFEKDGARLTVTVDGERLAELELSDRDVRKAAGQTVGFCLHSAWKKGEGGRVRATLQEFSFSPDCLRRR